MDLTVKYRRCGGHGTWEGPTDLTVRYNRKWGGVMGHWRDLGMLSLIHI